MNLTEKKEILLKKKQQIENLYYRILGQIDILTEMEKEEILVQKEESLPKGE